MVSMRVNDEIDRQVKTEAGIRAVWRAKISPCERSSSNGRDHSRHFCARRAFPCRTRGCLEPDLPHDCKEIRLLNGFGDCSREQAMIVVGMVAAAVCTNGNDGGAGVLAVGALDVSRGAFTVEDGHL
jgi:hypothetical protein